MTQPTQDPKAIRSCIYHMRPEKEKIQELLAMQPTQDPKNDHFYDAMRLKALPATKPLDDNAEPTVDEPNKLQELFDDYHIVKYDNIDGYTRLSQSESDWHELYTSITAYISDQVAKAEALLINNIDNALDDIEGTASGRYYPFMDTKSRLSTIQEIANELKEVK